MSQSRDNSSERPGTGDEAGPGEQARVRDAGPLGLIVSSLNAIGTIGILGLMVLINSDILGRALFNNPIAGVPEMVSFSIVGIVFLQLAHTLRAGSLTRSDMVLNLLGKHAPLAHRLAIVLFNLIGAALLTIVLIRFFPNFMKAYNDPARHFMGNPGFFTISQWPLFGMMLIGIAATIVQFLASAWNGLLGRGDEIRQTGGGHADVANGGEGQ